MSLPTAPIKKTKQKKEARDIRAEALKIANSVKTEHQSGQESKAIAAGIQRGMALFLRQQSEKTSELDKRVKKVKQLSRQLTQPTLTQEQQLPPAHAAARLPWLLLACSWIVFLVAAVVAMKFFVKS